MQRERPSADNLPVDAIDLALRRASFLASWSGAAGFKRARSYFLADLVVLELARAELPLLATEHSVRARKVRTGLPG
jgi:hypothetical protein